MNFVNEAAIFDRWSGIISEATDIKETAKLNWMSKLCHVQELYENNTYATVNTINGMGATRFPGDPGTQAGFATQATGSGDKGHSILPLAMQVAAQTVGLDLVPVVPMPGPMGVLTYLDHVYGGGKTAGTGADIPLMVKANYGTGTVPAFVAGATSEATNGLTFTFIGSSRLDGYPIFKVDGTMTSGTIQDNLDTVIGGTGIGGVTGGTGAVELVKALEDHITGFSGSALADDVYSGAAVNDPYSRGAGESTHDNVMNLSLFNKSVEAKTFQVAAAVTREQVQDLRQFGIDAVAQVETVLINEVTQSINKNILTRMFELGERNHAAVLRTQGTNFFLNLGATALLVSAGPAANPSTAFGSYINDANLLGATMASTENVNSASENLHSRQRKVMSKALAISNLISIRGRRGAATFIVTNGQVASALQDCAGFIAAPMANTLNQTSGSLYPVGTLAGLAVYVDPNMAWEDTRFCVGRKGDGNEPGLVFMPYLMAESVEAIVEGTMGPKIAVKSRYDLVEAGFHPETMYFTSGVFMGAPFGSLA